jgi:hypothetical protein
MFYGHRHVYSDQANTNVGVLTYFLPWSPLRIWWNLQQNVLKCIQYRHWDLLMLTNIFGVYNTQLTLLRTLTIKGQAVFQKHISENEVVIPPHPSSWTPWNPSMDSQGVHGTHAKNGCPYVSKTAKILYFVSHDSLVFHLKHSVKF